MYTEKGKTNKQDSIKLKLNLIKKKNMQVIENERRTMHDDKAEQEQFQEEFLMYDGRNRRKGENNNA